jgi:desampylase
MTLTISRALHAELLARAAAEPDREVCGLLFGEVDIVDAILPCANVSPNPADSFEIDPAALIAAHKAERAGGRTLIGYYHSHPNGVGELSARDNESAGASGMVCAIVAAGAVFVWRMEMECGTPLRVGVLQG